MVAITLCFRAALVGLLVSLAGCMIDVATPEGGEPPDPGDCVGETCTESDDEPVVCADSEAGVWFSDGDGDGFGDTDSAMEACSAPEGYVADGGDCDDANDQVNPLAQELCGDDVDNDCDGGDACLQSLLARWDFTSETDGVVPDASGNDNVATLLNGATLSGPALVLDGADDYAVVDHVEAFAQASGTVSLWTHPEVGGAQQGLFSKDSSGFDTGGHLSIRIESSDQVRVRLQSDAADYIILDPGTIAAGTWHHVAVTFGTDGLKLYVDGIPVADDAYSGGMEGNSEPIALGSSTATSGDGVAEPTTDPATGELSDVRIFARALTGAEISDLVQLTSPVP